MSNSIKDSVQAFAVNQVLKYVDSNPQEAFPKLLDWADKFDKDNLYLTQRQQIRKVMEQPDSNWMRLINSLWTDIDSEVRKVFFRNFIVNASLLGSRKQVANREKYGCNIPWAILMDPTSACNLHCTGCWAAEYGNKLNLSYEELDDIINQANELGTYMFLYTGGEPMLYPELGEKARNNGHVVYSLDFEVTPHQLRHTYITNLIHSSVDPKTVQYLAGHESSKITMDIYAKVKYNRPDELVRTMGNAFAQWDAVRA